MKFILLASLLLYCYNVTHAQFLYPDGQQATQQNPEQTNLLTLERETAAREAARENAIAAGNSILQKGAEHQQQQIGHHHQPQTSYSFFYADSERAAEGNKSAMNKNNFQIYFVPFNAIVGQQHPVASAQGVRKFDATNQAAARQFYVPQQQQQLQQQQQQQIQYQTQPQLHQPEHQQQDHQQQRQNLQNTAPQAFPTTTLAIPQNSQSYMTFHQHPGMLQQQMSQMFYPQASLPQLQHPAGTMPLRTFVMPQFASFGNSQPQHLSEQFQAPFRASPFMGYNFEQSVMGPMAPRMLDAHVQMQGNFYPTTGQHYHRYVKPIYENTREGQPSGTISGGDQATASDTKNAEKFFYLSPQNMYALFRSRRS